MLDILKLIIQILISILCICIIYQLLDRKLSFKTAILIGIAVGVFWNRSSLFGIGVLNNLLLYRMLMVILVYIGSRVNILKVLVAVFVTSNVTLMVDYNIIVSIMMIQDIPSQSYLNDSITYIKISIISSVFYFGFYLILKKYKLSLFDSNKNYYSLDATFSQNSNITTRIKEFLNNNNLLIIILVTQMTLITYYFYDKEYFIVFYSEDFGFEYKTIFLSLIITTINIITLFMAKKIEKDREEKYHNKIKKIEYAQMKKEISISREYKHDLNNHFTLLSNLVGKKKYDEVSNYLAMYHEDMHSKIIPIETGSDELDVLLYSKINKAQQSHIKINYKCSADIQCNKEHIIDFISIIGNLLDNAIEASEKSEKKFISININEGTIHYYFTIRNTVKDLKIEEPFFILQEGFTTKGSGRGLGLKIVNRLVKKYNGNIEFNNDENFFEINLILPKHELERY